MNQKYSTLFSRISVFMLFLICNSSSLLASNTQEYQVPRQSMSYLMQQDSSPDDNAKIIMEPAPETDQEISMSWQKAEPQIHEQIITEKSSINNNNNYSDSVDLITIANQTQEQNDTIAEDTPFGKTLQRMQKRSAQRRAEAAQLGITLPSQSGDIGAVSPSLNRLNQVVNAIIHRA